MASGPDLFVVCKSCGSEVSPYITECPYCGTRLRKRAPKLDRAGTVKPPRRARPRLAPLRRGEIPGIRPDRRPYATIALVARLGRRDAARARRLGPDRRARAVRPARRRLVASRDDAVRLRQHRLRGGGARGRRDLRRPARAPARLVGAAHGLPRRRHARNAARGGVDELSARDRRQRGGARARSPRGRCATCSGAARAARTMPTCSARWPSPRCWCCCRWRPSEAHALAGLGGGVAGILMGLGLARLR